MWIMNWFSTWGRGFIVIVELQWLPHMNGSYIIYLSGIIGGAKVRRIFKYFNCVLHNYIRYIHNCNHWLSYFKLHDTLYCM